MIDLSDSVALVTAGSRGLGAEIVRQLARQGADVAFTYLQNRSAAEALTDEVKTLGRRCLAVQADASDFQKAHQVVSRVQSEMGGIHILVCNAGFSRGVPIWKMSESDWDDVVDVSLKGAFNYIRAVAPIYMEQSYGLDFGQFRWSKRPDLARKGPSDVELGASRRRKTMCHNSTGPTGRAARPPGRR